MELTWVVFDLLFDLCVGQVEQSVRLRVLRQPGKLAAFGGDLKQVC